MLKSAASFIIKAYQNSLRHILPTSCRFTPSCSEYAHQAINKYGFLKGGLKALARIMHCHPWSAKSGYDPLL